MKKRRRCQWCEKMISLKRENAAISRGGKALYCSTKCRGNANTARYRARKKLEEPKNR